MITNTNAIILEGGLTKDPEVYESANVVHISLAVDNAGSEKGVKNASGYFDVKFWLNPSAFASEASVESVKKMLAEKTLQKGSKISIVGRMVQERWEKDGKKSSKVVVIADNIQLKWAGKNAASTSSSSSTSSNATSASSYSEPIEF